MRTNGVIAGVFVTPHLMLVDLTALGTAVTSRGCQVIVLKQVEARVSLPGRQPPRQHLNSCSSSCSFTKASSLQSCCAAIGVQTPAHSSESAWSWRGGSGNPCDDCAPACKNRRFGRLPHTQTGPELLLIRGPETTHNVDMISLARASVQDLVGGSSILTMDPSPGYLRDQPAAAPLQRQGETEDTEDSSIGEKKCNMEKRWGAEWRCK